MLEFKKDIVEFWGKHPFLAPWICWVVLPSFLILAVAWEFGWVSLVWKHSNDALQAFSHIENKNRGAEYIRAYGSLVSSIGLMIAGPAAMITFLVTLWGAHNKHQDSQLATRKYDVDIYTKAVEQLGSENQSVRMGAILVMKELGVTSATYHKIIIEVLCAHIRVRREKNFLDSKGGGGPIPEDIQMTLDAIFYLLEQNPRDDVTLNFKEIDLQGAIFENRILKRVIFEKANLQTSDFSFSQLHGCTLEGADLSHARLNRTQLKDVNARGAIFYRSIGRAVRASGCNFIGAVGWPLAETATTVAD